MKTKLTILCTLVALVFSSCSKETYYFNTSGQSIGAYHKSGEPAKPELQATVAEEPMLEASLENAPVIITSPVYATEKVSTVTNIKNLYNSDIADIKTFRKEYKKVKEEFKVNNHLSKKDIKSTDATKGDGGGLSIASFVLGLVGLLVAGMICGILAVVFGAIGLAKGKKKGFAIAGLILGIIDIIAVLAFVAST